LIYIEQAPIHSRCHSFVFSDVGRPPPPNRLDMISWPLEFIRLFRGRSDLHRQERNKLNKSRVMEPYVVDGTPGTEQQHLLLLSLDAESARWQSEHDIGAPAPPWTYSSSFHLKSIHPNHNLDFFTSHVTATYRTYDLSLYICVCVCVR